MNACAVESKRAQPILGTFVSISIKGPSELQESAFAAAFAEVRRMENLFSSFNQASDLSSVNRAAVGQKIEVDEILGELLLLALSLWRESSGAFNPFLPNCPDLETSPLTIDLSATTASVCKLQPVTLDLNGIAKGFIVDKIAELLAENIELSGVVNAGGDMRFFNSSPENVIHLRLGSMSAPVLRPLKSSAPAIATSSPALALSDTNSSTRYFNPPRAPLTSEFSAVVCARDCAVADALTKAALFAEPSVIEHCARVREASILLFDVGGTLQESYGAL